MKKMILSLILSLTALMAIDFTMTPKGLFPETTIEVPIADTTPEGSNPYLEPVKIPECDGNDPEVQFIKTTSDWDRINDSNKRIFCVSPGNYKSLGAIKLKVSGTAAKRRYIVLNNGNNIHPGKLSADQRANYILNMYNVNYWTVDRQSAIGNVTVGTEIKNGASYNIINRMFTADGIGTSVRIKRNCNNNTIQNSRFTEQKTPSDLVAINIIDLGVDTFSSKNNKIINNEFVDQNDGIQITRMPLNGATPDSNNKLPFQDVNAEGTIIDSNIFYLRDTASDMENAMDFKAASSNPANPIVVTNNKMWGYKENHGSSAIIVAHHNSMNIKFNNNVFFDSRRAFVAGTNGRDATYTYGIIDGELAGNLFYNCGYSIDRPVITLGSSKNMNAQNNVIINAKSIYGKFSYLNNGSVFSNNIIVDTPNEHATKGSNTTFENSLSTTKTKARHLYTKDLVFTYDNFTNNPKTMVLKNVLQP